jgi:hypothetical protein
VNEFLDSPEIPDELHTWLLGAAVADGWADDPPLEDLRCHPDLVERLASLVRPLRPARVFVAGCPVIHVTGGHAFAAAFGTSTLLCRVDASGVLPSAPAFDGWLALDPWPQDIAFTRGTDLMRQLLAQAALA